ncbi:chromosome segregation protein ScpA [Candidatus Nitrosotenuis uzonensis]|uniref:Chromosome segregation and condensation protein ScpA n=1 Tax=Candidatus Nitrosotenuis uzonensis TaxID=1407055 RepID=A0A812F1Z4_9ARCH|nr:chromosome segregation protein ScpA [Candidatus Nitrosotenuis uzonensis]MCA2003671.1 chromosome segregation protein ScpA [Candidatus Nitrosotenuis sp.]CAE6504756.1 Chromosome segregation and condensation protein ScpA [Candidatus Nitrosotenuis uzonensis]
MSHSVENISQAPVNVLFNPNTIAKKDVWEINIVQILEILISILKKADKKDLRVAGMAALSSSLIHRMKVERIFALQKAAMEKKPMRERSDVDIQLLNIPYRHEATYPVTLDELLDLLENLIGTIANPRSRRGNQLRFEPVEVPDFKDYFVSLENIIGKYEDLILRKIENDGFGFLHKIVADLDVTDSIRCFFAILFLARDQKVDLEQIDDDIKITLIQPTAGA